MTVDKLLARFSIQTKVIVFIVPLVLGMGILAAINMYTGNMLGQRLVGTGASIETLSGFKKAYAEMTEFLREQNEERRTAVEQSLDSQLARLDEVIALAETEAETVVLKNARALADQVHTDVAHLWELHEREVATRAEFDAILAKIVDVRARLKQTIDATATEMNAAEAEAKGLLRNAELLGDGAQMIVKISGAISGARTPEEVIEAATALRPDIANLHTVLPGAVPATKPAVKSLLSDNLGSLIQTLDTKLPPEQAMLELQKYANSLRPAGIMLQGLASQEARKAMVRFGELDQPIQEGQQMTADAREFLTALAEVELAIVEFTGHPNQTSGEALAARLSALDQGVALLSFSDVGEPILDAIGEDWIATMTTIPGFAADLVEEANDRTRYFQEASEHIDLAWNGVLDFANSQQSGAEAVKDEASGISLSAAIVGGAFGLIAAFMLVTALKGPIRRLVTAMRDVAGGDLDVDVTDAARADEIGEMARALDVFKKNAIDKIRIEGESEQAREQAARERERTDEEKAQAEAELQFAVRSLGAALRALSQGNLVSTIDTPFSGELDSLRVDFNESIDKMRATLTQIRDNAGSISSNSDQMRAAADDLARRTEQQAASLEETAAAVDQISATVRTASSRAADTDKLAGDTANDARASGEIVGRAVDAMSRIEEASGKINQIIGVIDEIAFQTNLLALNAGVEAARAGEAGKGFAVVAQEVRELAGRSASAAKEIKELIARSGEEVRSGVTLVGETGEAITRIIARIEEISEHVGAMATASQEQASGLAEVNTAVNQMDQMTQQNAAMVEETNASSHTLAQEAEALTALVARFRLDMEQATRQAASQAA